MTELHAPISAVVVYPDRARILRGGSLTLAVGRHVLEVNDLSLSLQPDSVRAAARGTAKARLHGVQVQHSFFQETPAEDTRKLEEQLEKTQDAIGRVQAQMELIKHNQANIRALASQAQIYATALAAGEMSVEKQLGLYDALQKRLEGLENELQQATEERRKLERQQAKLARELEQRRSSQPRERYTAQIEVEVLEAGELAVELSYVTAGAGWEALYDLRLLEEAGKSELEVHYLGQVHQQTGEDWEQVALTLSTARPELASRMPELEPWFIGGRPMPRSVPPRMAQPAPMMAMSAAKEMGGGENFGESGALADLPAEVVQAMVSESGASVSYAAPGKVSVRADGALHKVTVAVYRLGVKLDYVSAPKVAGAVYRRAKVRNEREYTLLAGWANLFHGEEFAGGTQLPMTPPQAEMELYLGVEDRIKVERELKRREVDKRLLGGRARIQQGYEIRLENHLGQVAEVVVKDQFPVSQRETIKTRLEFADPKPSEQSELNLLTWRLVLQPGEKRVVRFDFEISGEGITGESLG